MPRLLDAPRAYLRDLRAAFVHAPLEVLLGIALSITFSISVRNTADRAVDPWGRTAALAAIAMAPLFGLSVLRALGRISPVLRWAGSAALLACAGAYAALVFDAHHGAEVWRTAALAGAGVFVMALAPEVGGSRGEERRLRTWRFWAATGTRTVVVGAYAVVLYLALAGAIAAVASLFDVKPEEHLYADIAGAIFFALVPWVVVGGIPEIARATEDDAAPTPRAVGLLGRWLYLPVVAIYGAILYAYTARVLVSGALPKNLLSPLVLFAALFALIGAVWLEPLRTDAAAGAARRVTAWAPAAVLPLLPLAFHAVLLRQDQHGWTEFRYLRLALLVAASVLSVAGAVRLVRKRPPLLAAVPAVLAIVLLVSAVGPWSAPAVSRRDQLGRLRAALAEAGMLRNGRMMLPAYRANKPVEPVRRVISRDRYDRIDGTVRYLAGEHGPKSMAGIIPQADTYPDPWPLLRALPIKAGCEENEARSVAASLGTGVGISGLQAGSLYRLRVVGARDADTLRTSGAVVAVVDGTALRVRRTGPGGWQARADLAAVIARLKPGRSGCSSPADVPLADEDGAFVDGSLPPEEALRPLADGAGRPVGQLLLTRLEVRDSVRAGRRVARTLTEAAGWVLVLR